VNDEIVWRMIRNLINLQKRRLQDARQVLILPFLRILKTGIVRLWSSQVSYAHFLIFKG
jgi:hypothetical protein